jgi:hypothetical protein
MVDNLLTDNYSFIDLLEGSQLHRNEDADDPIIFQHSPYYEDEGFMEILSNKSSIISIMSLNCQSINSKFDQINLYMNKYTAENRQISILCLQETWLTAGYDLLPFHIEGYNLISTGKSCSAHGGVAIYLKEDFKYKVIKHNTSEIWDGLFLEISFVTNLHETKKIIVGNIYRPPRPSIENITMFTSEISEILYQFRNYKNVILSGDYNLDLMKFRSNSHINDFLETLITNGYVPKISMPTRLSHQHGTLIDNFFVKISENYSSTTAGVLINQISDHFPYFITLDYLSFRKPQTKYVETTTSGRQAYQNFKTDLQADDIKNMFAEASNENVNVNYSKFHEFINSKVDKHFPIKLTRFNKYKHRKINGLHLES